MVSFQMNSVISAIFYTEFQYPLCLSDAMNEFDSCVTQRSQSNTEKVVLGAALVSSTLRICCSWNFLGCPGNDLACIIQSSKHEL